MKNTIDVDFLTVGRKVFWEYGDEKFSGTIVGFSKHRITEEIFVRVEILECGESVIGHIPVEDIMNRLAVYN